MSETIFYIKQGRKYIPHSTYSSDFCDGFPNGSHLVTVKVGGTSRRYKIDPAYAPLIAAGMVAEDAIAKTLLDKSSLRVKETPLTYEQREAWNRLIEVFGPDAKSLEWPSARETSQCAVDAMINEAEKLLTHPSVKKAYEHFLIVCKLTKENNFE